MWVFNVSSSDIAGWTGKILFRPLGDPPENIQYTTSLQWRLINSGTPWVFFGTGDRENPTDQNSKDGFYAVKDDGKDPYPRQENNLKNVTTYIDKTFVTPQDPLKGWYIRLANSEKVLAKPTVFSKLLYFTTYTYTSTDACKELARQHFILLNIFLEVGLWSIDDYLQGTSFSPFRRHWHWKQGVPSAPVISVNLKGKASVTIGTTSGQILSRQSTFPYNQ